MVNEEECIFCKILAGSLEASFIYRDAVCSAFMDIQPVNAGHLLVVPNKHVRYLADLEASAGAHVFRIAQRLSTALRLSGVRCEGINLFLADGEAAQQEVPHVHLHVFPRYTNDGFGLKFAPTYFEKPDRADLNTVAEKIRNALNSEA